MKYLFLCLSFFSTACLFAQGDEIVLAISYFPAEKYPYSPQTYLDVIDSLTQQVSQKYGFRYEIDPLIGTCGINLDRMIYDDSLNQIKEKILVEHNGADWRAKFAQDSSDFFAQNAAYLAKVFEASSFLDLDIPLDSPFDSQTIEKLTGAIFIAQYVHGFDRDTWKMTFVCPAFPYSYKRKAAKKCTKMIAAIVSTYELDQQHFQIQFMDNEAKNKNIIRVKLEN